MQTNTERNTEKLTNRQAVSKSKLLFSLFSPAPPETIRILKSYYNILSYQ